jgi:antitoxin component of MazEF toxin-antitoxin module
LIKQIRKVGNSNAILLDKPLLEMVGLREGESVQVIVDHGNIIISPVDPHPVDDARAQELLERIVTRRRGALKRLAE